MTSSSKTHAGQTTLERSVVSKYQPQKYEHLIGIKGFSEKLLTNHFKLYQGYVTNTNTAAEELHALLQSGKEKSPGFAEVKRRFGWEWNGMRLHEYYFGNLGGKEALSSTDALHQAISSQFGTFEEWKKDFIATGAMRGIGWALLYFDKQAGRFFNIWIEQHNGNHLVGETPLLILDVFEHAYTVDYGTDKQQYITAFFENVNWQTVSDRYAVAR